MKEFVMQHAWPATFLILALVLVVDRWVCAVITVWEKKQKP